MQHCTPEQLSLAALGEPLPADDATHLESCPACAAEVASLRRAVDAVAVPQLAAPGEPVQPPPHVWAAIAAATGVSAGPEIPAPAPDAVVVPLRPWRRPLLLVAASVVVGAVVGAGAVAVLRGGDHQEPRTVETAALQPLAGNEASGTAEVVARPDGSRALELRLDAPAASGGYYEVWLAEASITEMLPVGIARSGTQTFELPDDLDLGEFTVVDVSLEPLDGDPAHSSVSVARGQLES
ncbi:MAG: anti-sigma factor domain-containing protein [Blastococcus sp.]